MSLWVWDYKAPLPPKKPLRVHEASYKNYKDLHHSFMTHTKKNQTYFQMIMNKWYNLVSYY